MRPALVPVALSSLVLNEEFETRLTHRRGRVLAWGWWPWDDGTGRRTRVRCVLVAYGTQQVVHRAELTVLVPADRPHMRISDETRWSERLPEPGTFATIGERVITRALPNARGERKGRARA